MAPLGGGDARCRIDYAVGHRQYCVQAVPSWRTAKSTLLAERVHVSPLHQIQPRPVSIHFLNFRIKLAFMRFFFKLLFPTLVVSLAFLLGCAKKPVIGTTEFTIITHEQELELGEQTAEKILETEKVVTDPKYTKRVEEVFRNLIRALPPKFQNSYDWKVYVLDRDMTLPPLKQRVSRSFMGASYSIGIVSFPPYGGRVSPSTGRNYPDTFFPF